MQTMSMSAAEPLPLHSDHAAVDDSSGVNGIDSMNINLGDESAAHHNHDRNGPVGTPKRLWQQFAGDTLTAARMHAADKGKDERNEAGTVLNDVDESTASAYVCHMDTSDLEEYLPRIMPPGGSLGAAIFGLIKGTVGPAILYLPKGFQTSGWAVAVPSMILATAMYVFNAGRLLQCWQAEHERNDRNRARSAVHNPVPSLTYPELARRAFGPLSVLVDVGIAALQFGVCLTYLIFVPHNLAECATNIFGAEFDKLYFLTFMITVEIPLGWIRDITRLTPTNVVATGLIVYGLFFVIVLAFVHGLGMVQDDGTARTAFAYNFDNLPAFTDSWFVFVGTSFFMMEGSITLVVPLQESIVRSEDRAAFPRGNRVATTAIVAFYIAFSLVCCGAFGDDIHTALTASLDGTLATTIQLAYSVAVILTFPLQAFPAMEVVHSYCTPGHRGDDGGGDDVMRRRIVSTLTICILGVVAVSAIDYLGNVVSILGSLFGIPLALIVPPLMHNKLVSDTSRRTRWVNYGIALVGFLAAGAASLATIVTWDKEEDP